MYRTSVVADDALEALDDALVRLRRLWVSPASPAAPQDGGGPPLPMSTVLVVDAVHRLVTAQQEATVTAVAARIDVAASTASRLVDRAVDASMVRRGTSTVDARRTVLSLTPEGQALFRSAVAFRRGTLREILDGWAPADVATLADLLTRFAAAAHAPAGEAPTSKQQR